MSDVGSAPLLAAFGKAVRSLRAAQGLSQEALADLAGVHRTYMGDVERGRRNISLININRLADALSVDLPTLMAEVEKARRT